MYHTSSQSFPNLLRHPGTGGRKKDSHQTVRREGKGRAEKGREGEGEGEAKLPPGTSPDLRITCKHSHSTPAPEGREGMAAISSTKHMARIRARAPSTLSLSSRRHQAPSKGTARPCTAACASRVLTLCATPSPSSSNASSRDSVSPSNVAQARALLSETRRQQEEQRRLAWLAAKEGGSAAGTSRTNETDSWSTAEVEAEPEQEHAEVVLPDFNAPVHGTGSVSASAENMQADYAKARAEIAVRRQRGAEERRQAWLAAKEGAYAAASEAKTRADTKAYARAREQIQSIRRMEAKPKAFAAAGTAKAQADEEAYFKARDEIQSIREKDSDARLRAYQEAKQKASEVRRQFGAGAAAPSCSLPPPKAVDQQEASDKQKAYDEAKAANSMESSAPSFSGESWKEGQNYYSSSSYGESVKSLAVPNPGTTSGLVASVQAWCTA